MNTRDKWQWQCGCEGEGGSAEGPDGMALGVRGQRFAERPALEIE